VVGEIFFIIVFTNMANTPAVVRVVVASFSGECPRS